MSHSMKDEVNGMECNVLCVFELILFSAYKSPSQPQVKFYVIKTEGNSHLLKSAANKFDK